MKRLFTTALAAAMFAASGAASSQTVPSCYAAAGLPVSPPTAERSVVVVVDQTTALDADLRETLRSSFVRLLQPGTNFTIVTFSAFRRGHHTRVLSAGSIEGQVPRLRRPDLAVNRLARLDRCLSGQVYYGRRVAEQALARSLSVPPAQFANSEIMASLAQVSERVRISPGRRIVIVASDLMENSSAAVFYGNRNLREINPTAELNNARRLRLTGNFGRAAVFVIGTGMLPPEAGRSTRHVRDLNALVDFWTGWFRASNAGSVVIGRPNVLVPIR